MNEKAAVQPVEVRMMVQNRKNYVEYTSLFFYIGGGRRLLRITSRPVEKIDSRKSELSMQSVLWGRYPLKLVDRLSLVRASLSSKTVN